MAPRRLSDTFLKSLKPAPAGQRLDVMDAHVPGLGVRVSDSGRKTWMLIARYPGSTNPTRRALGEYPSLSLEEARKKAASWRDLIKLGKDPKDEQAAQRRAELRKREDTFDAVAEEFIRRVLPKQRRGEIVAHEIRENFCNLWRGRPITSIDRRDVIDIIGKKAESAPYQAHNLLGHVRALFNWVIEIGSYGLETSPCDRIRPKVLIGDREPRQRTLDDAELSAFWKATAKLGYPFGPLFRLLLLTGARKSEISEARWCEFDLDKATLTVPAERFKSNADHLIPLTKDAVNLLGELPEFKKHDCLFSATFGKTPVSGFAGAKDRLDELMAAELGRELKPWRTHDLRRTVRTRLAGLRVADIVAEMVIGHGRRGLQRVYDQHKYVDEMREALELWAGRLRSIVTPAPDNVRPLRVGTLSS